MKNLFGEELQQNLWQDHYKDMPEYKNIEMVEPVMTMTFKFASVEDFEHFHKLIRERMYDGERVLRGTQKETEKYSWWPIKETAGEFKYVDEE